MSDLNTGLSESVSQRPRAIAKEKDGVVLYWVEELGVAGLHQSALASLLGCDNRTASNFVKGVKESGFLDAEILTTGGVQGVKLLSESILSDLLIDVICSKAKQETRDRAKAILKKLAAAGYKLMVMLELAPAELAARAVSHVGQQSKTQTIIQASNGLIAAREVSEIEALLANNPRLAQLCVDDAMNRVLGQKAIAQSQEPVLRGVNEIAIEMGYKTDGSLRVKLGQFIKAQGFAPIKEKRICNGVMTDINCYPDTKEIRDAIGRFFS